MKFLKKYKFFLIFALLWVSAGITTNAITIISQTQIEHKDLIINILYFIIFYIGVLVERGIMLKRREDFFMWLESIFKEAERQIKEDEEIRKWMNDETKKM